MKPEDRLQACCRNCQSTRLVRVLSSFAWLRTEAQRVAEMQTGASRSENFYRDDWNVGLWAQKRLHELGVDLGSGFEETVEKARSGKLPDGEWI